MNIIRYKAFQWAKEHNTYVFKWKCTLGQEENRPSENQMVNLIEKNAFFWQFWVAGTDAYLSYNINGDLALVNGAPLITHSLTFDNSIDIEIIKRATVGTDKKPYGSEIEVSEPLSINMIVPESFDGKPISDKRRSQLKELQKLSMSSEKSLSLSQNTAKVYGKILATTERTDFHTKLMIHSIQLQQLKHSTYIPMIWHFL